MHVEATSDFHIVTNIIILQIYVISKRHMQEGIRRKGETATIITITKIFSADTCTSDSLQASICHLKRKNKVY